MFRYMYVNAKTKMKGGTIPTHCKHMLKPLGPTARISAKHAYNFVSLASVFTHTVG